MIERIITRKYYTIQQVNSTLDTDYGIIIMNCDYVVRFLEWSIRVSMDHNGFHMI
jgi:hypothetical protein